MRFRDPLPENWAYGLRTKFSSLIPRNNWIGAVAMPRSKFHQPVPFAVLSLRDLSATFDRLHDAIFSRSRDALSVNERRLFWSLAY